MGNPCYGAMGEEAPPPYVKEEVDEHQRPDGQHIELPTEGDVPVGILVRPEAGGPPDEPHYLNLEQV